MWKWGWAIAPQDCIMEVDIVVTGGYVCVRMPVGVFS